MARKDERVHRARTHHTSRHCGCELGIVPLCGFALVFNTNVHEQTAHVDVHINTRMRAEIVSSPMPVDVDTRGKPG